MNNKVININTYRASKELETAYRTIYKERVILGLNTGYTTIKVN